MSPETTAALAMVLGAIAIVCSASALLLGFTQ